MPSKQQQIPRKKTAPFIGSRVVVLVKQERRLNDTFWFLMSATQDILTTGSSRGEGKGFGHMGVGGSLPRSILVKALLLQIESKIHAICYCLIAQGPLNAFNH